MDARINDSLFLASINPSSSVKGLTTQAHQAAKEVGQRCFNRANTETINGKTYYCEANKTDHSILVGMRQTGKQPTVLLCDKEPVCKEACVEVFKAQVLHKNHLDQYTAGSELKDQRVLLKHELTPEQIKIAHNEGGIDTAGICNRGLIGNQLYLELVFTSEPNLQQILQEYLESFRSQEESSNLQAVVKKLDNDDTLSGLDRAYRTLNTLGIEQAQTASRVFQLIQKFIKIVNRKGSQEQNNLEKLLQKASSSADESGFKITLEGVLSGVRSADNKRRLLNQLFLYVYLNQPDKNGVKPYSSQLASVQIKHLEDIKAQAKNLLSAAYHSNKPDEIKRVEKWLASSIMAQLPFGQQSKASFDQLQKANYPDSWRFREDTIWQPHQLPLLELLGDNARQRKNGIFGLPQQQQIDQILALLSGKGDVRSDQGGSWIAVSTFHNPAKEKAVKGQQMGLSMIPEQKESVSLDSLMTSLPEQIAIKTNDVGAETLIQLDEHFKCIAKAEDRYQPSSESITSGLHHFMFASEPLRGDFCTPTNTAMQDVALLQATYAHVLDQMAEKPLSETDVSVLLSSPLRQFVAEKYAHAVKDKSSELTQKMMQLFEQPQNKVTFQKVLADQLMIKKREQPLTANQ